MAWKVTADLLQRFDEALAFFRSLTVFTDGQLEELTLAARRQAFWISGVTQLRVVQSVFGAIERAIDKGEPFADFKKRVRPALEKAWGVDKPELVETVFRNAVQRSYNAGRYGQMRDPAVRRIRPYWMYDAILDTRTTPICQKLDKKVVPADDPWWQGRIPPLHHRCRSSIRALTEAAALERGITSALPSDRPAGSFGAAPGEPWRPNPDDYDHDLYGSLLEKEP